MAIAPSGPSPNWPWWPRPFTWWPTRPGHWRRPWSGGWRPRCRSSSGKEIRGDDYARQLLIETPEGAQSELDVDGVFVETGLVPNADAVAGLVETDEKGRVIIDRINRTSCPGLFAAGDVTDAFAEQVLIAVGEGAKAALSAYDYLLPNL